jgi:FkbM family methyltransferase
MSEVAALTLVDGVRVVVPNSIELITPYVLREQQDFFEDELRFVRALLQPGQKVVDIGANYGVYTLSMAQRVGPDGHVWAFEPASSTAQFLAQGIRENAFGHVTLEQAALSSSPGTAQLSLQRDPELNSIIHGQQPTAGSSETVSVVTLDQCMDRYRWTDIELIKIDAEGEESNIVRGGTRFFANLAPLVQYELKKDATHINVGLIQQFAAQGYDSYRLVPGLNCLVPFDAGSTPDAYLLNLFCCNATRAERLVARGALVRNTDLATRKNPGQSDTDAKYHWSNELAHLPFAAPLIPAWSSIEQAGGSAELIRALSLYSRSRDSAQSMPERFRALEAAFLSLNAECERDPVRLRLATLARVAHDYGARAVGVIALKRLLDYIREAGVDLDEPFLPPSERFDSIPLGTEPVPWLISAVLEQLEKREHYSTFYVGPTALGRLEDIHALGFCSAEMERRLDLVRQRIAQARRQARV